LHWADLGRADLRGGPFAVASCDVRPLILSVPASCWPEPNRTVTHNDDQKTGVEIVRKALSWPARQIALNAGEDGSVVIGKILEKDSYAFGFDAQSGEYVNMISKGIIDPTKVVRAALQGAASIGGLLITTEAMVAEMPNKQAPAIPAGGGMGGLDF
jgi:chaperonin GroEL